MKIQLKMRRADKLVTLLSRRATAKLHVRAQRSMRKLQRSLAASSDTFAGMR